MPIKIALKLMKIALKLSAAVVLVCWGLVECFRNQFPHHRTIEVAPGVYAEQWMTDGEVWAGIAVGVVLLGLSGGLCWSACRSIWHGRDGRWATCAGRGRPASCRAHASRSPMA